MMKQSSFAAPRVLVPLHDLWSRILQGPASPIPKSTTTLSTRQFITPNQLLTAKCHLGKTQPALATLAPSKPLRVIRILEKDHVPATVGRMLISGRMADVCAELDRMADREAALH